MKQTVVITLDVSDLNAADCKITGITIIDAETKQTIIDSDNFDECKDQVKEIVNNSKVLLFNYDFIDEQLSNYNIELKDYLDVMEDAAFEIDPDNDSGMISLKECVKKYKYKGPITNRQEKNKAILFVFESMYGTVKQIEKRHKKAKVKAKISKIKKIIKYVLIAFVVFCIASGVIQYILENKK